MLIPRLPAHPAPQRLAVWTAAPDLQDSEKTFAFCGKRDKSMCSKDRRRSCDARQLSRRGPTPWFKLGVFPEQDAGIRSGKNPFFRASGSSWVFQKA